MDDVKELRKGILISGQIAPSDIPALAAKGVKLIVNNRPDGEDGGQPPGDDIKAAAAAAGIAYAPIPVGPRGIGPADLDAFNGAFSQLADGDAALAFCRSGMRSVMLWALATARAGGEIDAIIADADAAGFDLSGHRDALLALKGAPTGV